MVKKKVQLTFKTLAVSYLLFVVLLVFAGVVLRSLDGFMYSDTLFVLAYYLPIVFTLPTSVFTSFAAFPVFIFYTDFLDSVIGPSSTTGYEHPQIHYLPILLVFNLVPAFVNVAVAWVVRFAFKKFLTAQ